MLPYVLSALYRLQTPCSITLPFSKATGTLNEQFRCACANDFFFIWCWVVDNGPIKPAINNKCLKWVFSKFTPSNNVDLLSFKLYQCLPECSIVINTAIFKTKSFKDTKYNSFQRKSQIMKCWRWFIYIFLDRSFPKCRQW